MAFRRSPHRGTGYVAEPSELNWRRQILRRALDQLKPREQRIIEARWLADTPLTLDELAAERSVSRERVRQTEVKALEKARAYAASLLSADVRDRLCARADTASSPSKLEMPILVSRSAGATCAKIPDYSFAGALSQK